MLSSYPDWKASPIPHPTPFSLSTIPDDSWLPEHAMNFKASLLHFLTARVPSLSPLGHVLSHLPFLLYSSFQTQLCPLLLKLSPASKANAVSPKPSTVLCSYRLWSNHQPCPSTSSCLKATTASICVNVQQMQGKTFPGSKLCVCITKCMIFLSF